MSPAEIATHVLLTVAIIADLLVLVKFVPFLFKFERTAKDLLILGITVSFIGQLLALSSISLFAVSGKTSIISDTFGTSWLIVVCSSLAVTIASTFHLVAITVCIGKKLTTNEYLCAALLFALITGVRLSV